MNTAPTSDPVWEEKYQRGYSQRYPWDVVGSFIFRHYQPTKHRSEIRILEIGGATSSDLGLRRGKVPRWLESTPAQMRLLTLGPASQRTVLEAISV